MSRTTAGTRIDAAGSAHHLPASPGHPDRLTAHQGANIRPVNAFGPWRTPNSRARHVLVDLVESTVTADSIFVAYMVTVPPVSFQSHLSQKPCL